jgi:hypothetical protein
MLTATVCYSPPLLIYGGEDSEYCVLAACWGTPADDEPTAIRCVVPVASLDRAYFDRAIACYDDSPHEVPPVVAAALWAFYEAHKAADDMQHCTFFVGED